MATYGSWQATIQNEFGDILPGSEVEVFLESTGLPATIFSGRTGGALANPFFADSNGFAQFYAATEEYRVVATDGGSGFTGTWRYAEVGAILGLEDTVSLIDSKLSLSGGTMTGDLNLDIGVDLRGRNFADDGYVPIARVDTNDSVILGDGTATFRNRIRANDEIRHEINGIEVTSTDNAGLNVTGTVKSTTSPVNANDLTRKDYVDDRTTDTPGDLHSYAFLVLSTAGQGIALGVDYSGGSLLYGGTRAASSSPGGALSGGLSGIVPAGTWRAFGHVDAVATFNAATIFKRVV